VQYCAITKLLCPYTKRTKMSPFTRVCTRNFRQDIWRRRTNPWFSNTLRSMRSLPSCSPPDHVVTVPTYGFVPVTCVTTNSGICLFQAEG